MSFKMKIKFDNLKKNKNKNGLGDKSCIVVGILRVLTLNWLLQTSNSSQRQHFCQPFNMYYIFPTTK